MSLFKVFLEECVAISKELLKFLDNNLYTTGSVLTGPFLNLLFYAILLFVTFPLRGNGHENDFGFTTVILIILSLISSTIITVYLSYRVDQKDTSNKRSAFKLYSNTILIGGYGLSVSVIFAYISLVAGVSFNVVNHGEIVLLILIPFILLSVIGVCTTLAISTMIYILYIPKKAFHKIKVVL